MKKTLIKLLATLCVLSIVVVACGDNKDSDDKKAKTEKSSESKMTEEEKMKAEEEAMMKKNIVEIAAADDNFSTLVTAVTAADLGATLSGDGPFTLFAPDNAAFAKIDKATLDTLLANKAELTKVLTYHAAAAKVLSGDLTDGMVVDTVEGSKLTINVKDGKVSVTTDAGVTANVTKADIQGSNGVIHVIDTVLLPKNLSL